jgi:hypothetical protein
LVTLYIDNAVSTYATFMATQRSLIGGEAYTYRVKGEMVVCHGNSLAFYTGQKATVRIDEDAIHVLSVCRDAEQGRSAKCLSRVLEDR